MTSPARPTVQLSARCACGLISVRVDGEILSMFLCACEDCQRATGTGHSTVALVRRTALTVQGGFSSFAREADSGATLTRHFCGDCGTPLFANSSRAEGIAMLPVGFFGKSSDWFHPNQVIFNRSHREWDLLPADIPAYATYRENEGQP